MGSVNIESSFYGTSFIAVGVAMGFGDNVSCGIFMERADSTDLNLDY
jgi:hypothetical protein